MSEQIVNPQSSVSVGGAPTPNGGEPIASGELSAQGVLPAVGTPPLGPSSPGGGAADLLTNTLVNLGLSQDVLGSDRFKGLNTVADLVKAFENASLAPAVVKPEEYTLPEGVPDSVRAVANELSLTQAQLDGVLNFQAKNFYEASQREAVELAAQGQAKLKEWGENAEAYLDMGKKAVAYLDKQSPGLIDMLQKSGYGNHPVVMELFRNVGNLLKEGGFNTGENFTPANTKTAAERMFPTHSS